MIKSFVLVAVGLAYVWLLCFLTTILDFANNYWWTGPYVLTTGVIGVVLAIFILASFIEII